MKLSTFKNLYSKSLRGFSTSGYNYSKLTPGHIDYFRSILNNNEVITNPDEVQPYNEDWTKKYIGKSELVLTPNSTEKISKILKFCNDNSLAVVPQGGNTGLVGGGVPISDEIVLSLKNLNKIENFNVNTGVLTCQAGCILEELNNHLREYSYEVPLDLGAKGSCHIGGNIATHAGGIHFVKYGPLRANILGMEVVLANGKILDLSSTVRKDNTGFDLKQLFIGSEGALGIITKANIHCLRLDKYSRVAFIECRNFKEVLKIHNLAKSLLGRNLSAVEFMDRNAYQSVVEHIPSVHKPYDIPKPEDLEVSYALVEISGSQPLDDIEEQFFSALDQEGLLEKCVIGENVSQAQNIWQIRESIATASSHMGSFLIYDFSLDINEWETFLVDMRKKVGHLGFVIGYGHIGDGNIHVNVVPHKNEDMEKMINLIEPYYFAWLKDKRGSISAEHGIGYMKANKMHYAKDDNVIEYLKQIKATFDPKNILNPKKILPYA